jgi:hypothetical protein
VAVLMSDSFIIVLDDFCDCTWRKFLTFSRLNDLHVLK